MREALRIGRRIDRRSGRYRLSGEVHTIRNGSREDGVWIAGTLRAGRPSRLVSFVGRGVGGCHVGCALEFEGYWDEHPDFGVRCNIDRVIRCDFPREERALVRYLSANVLGIGEVRARHLVKLFGSETLRRLAEDPSLPTRLWRGATGERITHGVRQWLMRISVERWSLEIAPQLMAEADISYTLAKRICSYFGSAEVADLIARRDPYRLLEVPGIGWETADAVATSMGIEEDSEERCRGAVLWALERLQAEGHSAVPRSLLVEKAHQLVRVDRKRVSRALASLVLEAEVVRANGLIYREEVLAKEWEVADLVRWLCTLDRTLDGEQRAVVEEVISDTNLVSAQIDAVWMALSNGVSLLTGRPGTGKTTVLKVIVDAARRSGLEVRLVAPTGKAASRATQVTGERAFTVHKLLCGEPGGERHGGPITRGLLIVEEASMLDLDTAAWLAANVVPGPDFRLLIVGDENQLPSVGHGQVVSDLLATEVVPAVTLTRILRRANGSTITQQAHRLLDGEELVLDESAEFRFVELPRDAVEAGDVVLNAVRRVIEEERSSLVRQLDRRPFDPCRDLQVLTPRNGGALGTAELNSLLATRLNPRVKTGPWIGGGQQVRKGDRVMCIENDYTVGEDGLFNGEQGVITNHGERSIELRLDDGRTIVTQGIQNGILSLAFAITIHKSQGSEYPVVVVVFHSSQYPLLDLRVLYTAITRAKERVILCADRRALAIAQEQGAAGSQRWTGLARMIA